MGTYVAQVGTEKPAQGGRLETGRGKRSVMETSSEARLAEGFEQEVDEHLLSQIGGVIAAKNPAGGATAETDLTDVPMLQEGGDADGQKRIALRAASEDVLPVIWEVDVDEHRSVPHDFDDCHLGGSFVDDGFAGGEGGDQSLQGQVVDSAG
jgi:hypothetical protein